MHTRTHTRVYHPHATPLLTSPHPAYTSSALPRTPLAHAKRAPHERCTRGGRQLGWRPQELSPSLHVNEFVNFTAHNTPPWAAALARSLTLPRFAGRRDGVLPAVSAYVQGPGSLASPYPVPLGSSPAAHHVLSVVAALAIPGSGPPPVASLCSSRRELPGARLGRDCGPQTGHRSGWRAGRREESPPGGDRAGRRGALRREEQGSTGRKINVSKYLQNLQIKKNF